MSELPSPDLAAAAAAVDTAAGVVDAAVRTLAADGGADAHQVVAYDIAHAASAVATCRSMLDYGARGDLEARLTCAFVADAIGELVPKVFGRESSWGVTADALDPTRAFVATFRAPEFVASLADTPGPRHLEGDFEMVQDAFRRFAADRIAPAAEHIHRTNADIPEEIIEGLAEIGAFGLSVPVEYEGFSEGGESEYIGMVVATEELTRASLGAGVRSSPDPRSSPGRCCSVAPNSRRRSGCRVWPRPRSCPRWR